MSETTLPSEQGLVIISGATASGKTDMVLEIARRLPTDIISADAAQVYRGMNIGTAKPDTSILERFPHQLIDIRNPEEAYSAAEFRRDALVCIERSFANGRIPLVTGGTMFYLSALVNGLSELPQADDKTRLDILEWAEHQGWNALHEELTRIDPWISARIRPSDRQRVQRALEIHRMTDRPPSEVMAASVPKPFPYPVRHIALFHPRRELLHRRIAQRFDSMLEQGFIHEVEELRSHPGLTAESTAMRTVGYRQAWSYLDGAVNHEDFVSSAVAATRQLAKRQLTWLRSTAGLIWMDASHDRRVDCLLMALEDWFPRALTERPRKLQRRQ